MTRLVFCEKFKKELPGLAFQPYPGVLGKKIFDTISKDAWQEWIGKQTIFVNEYRLNLSDAKARKMLEKEMEKFLFGDSQ